mmetsp:Transcript_21146/g.50227  ORF Transcript_21146/g.50227 Transcript_21146/m.50227 type:complete len:225 (+) Transcript_21146:318-992(+)
MPSFTMLQNRASGWPQAIRGWLAATYSSLSISRVSLSGRFPSRAAWQRGCSSLAEWSLSRRLRVLAQVETVVEHREYAARDLLAHLRGSHVKGCPAQDAGSHESGRELLRKHLLTPGLLLGSQRAVLPVVLLLRGNLAEHRCHLLTRDHVDALVAVAFSRVHSEPLLLLNLLLPHPSCEGVRCRSEGSVFYAQNLRQADCFRRNDLLRLKVVFDAVAPLVGQQK